MVNGLKVAGVNVVKQTATLFLIPKKVRVAIFIHMLFTNV